MSLCDKHVIYIGGFGGIGYASCQTLLNHAIKALVIMDSREDARKLSELQSKAGGIRIYSLQMDITDKVSIETAYTKANELFGGRIDVVINGSGVYNDQDPELTVQVNLLGLINSTLIACHHMDRAKGAQGGLILNISSITGLASNPLMAIYSATKCAIVGFTQALAHDIYYERTGIRFVTLCPGGTITDLIMEPENKSTFDFTFEMHRQKNALSKKQTPEECAKCLVNVMEIGENGSVWVCDLGKLEQIHMPVLWQRNEKIN